MPVLFRHRGYRFLSYSNEGDPREPLHVHVRKDEADAKFWLVPSNELAYNCGHQARELRGLAEVVMHRRDLMLEAWDDFFPEGERGPL